MMCLICFGCLFRFSGSFSLTFSTFSGIFTTPTRSRRLRPLLLCRRGRSCLLPLPLLRVHEPVLGLVQPVERVAGPGVLALVRVDEQREPPEVLLDLRGRGVLVQAQDAEGVALVREDPLHLLGPVRRARLPRR